MKTKFSPGAWLLFGFVGFPILCFASEVLGWIVVAAFHLLGLRPVVPQLGWGGLPGMFLGPAFGGISALSAAAWKNERFVVARFIAAGGGFCVGGWWLRWLLGCGSLVWIGEFGLAFTPLAWASALILFGLLARQPALR